MSLSRYTVSFSATGFKACLHVPSTFPCPSPSPSKFIIVSMETDRLMDRMGSVPILPVKWTITIGIMLYFDGDGDRHGDGDGTCKQAFNDAHHGKVATIKMGIR